MSARTPATRWLFPVEPSGPWSRDARVAFERWATDVVEGLDGLVGAELETLAPEEHRAFNGTDAQPRFCAFLSLWSTDRLEPGSLGGPGDAAVHALELEDRLRHDFPVEIGTGRTPGLKKNSLWHAAPGIGDWRERYEGHGDVALRCHRSAWRYRQNLVVSAPTGLSFDGVSELWWATAPALIERFYASEEARAEVKRDVVFVEPGTSVNTVTVHTVLRPPPQPAGVRRWVPEHREDQAVDEAGAAAAPAAGAGARPSPRA